MKKILFGLSITILAFLCGVFIAGIFRIEEKPMPKLLFEKEIVDVPLFEIAPINETDETEDVESLAGLVNGLNVVAWYSLKSYKGMPEVEMIGFSGTYFDNDGNKLEKMSYETGIFTNLFEDDVDEGYVEGIETVVDGNKLSFKTKKFKGIEYSFKGTFFKNKMVGEENEKVLRGTLQKFVKGKKTTEVSGDFAYSEPHCLH